jgi:hypothetical protein
VVSKFAFKFNLCGYTTGVYGQGGTGVGTVGGGGAAGEAAANGGEVGTALGRVLLSYIELYCKLLLMLHKVGRRRRIVCEVC